MKSQEFNKDVGATAGCTLRLLLNSIPEEKRGERHGIRGDAWFGSVRTANEVALRGHDGVFQIKQYHASFPKDYIEEALKDAPGGVHILLEGTTQDEVKLIALGYRYSRKTALHFVLTENAGNSKPGIPYQMKYTDNFGNICSRYVDRPQVVSNFFASSNTIDTHNQLRQDNLKLEKKWLTQSPWFRLSTTLIGIVVTNSFLLCNYHKVINVGSSEQQEKKNTIQRFAGILAHQLIQMANKLDGESGSKFLPETGPSFTVSATQHFSDISSPTLTNSFPITSATNIIRSATDANGILHYLAKYEVTQDPSGRKRTKMRKCKLCAEEGKRRDVGQYCITCGESYSLCNKCDERDCFGQHVKNIKRNTRQSKKNGSLP